MVKEIIAKRAGERIRKPIWQVRHGSPSPQVKNSIALLQS
jgi:hypothetical protein